MDNHESEFNKASSLLKGVRLSDAEKTSMLQNIYREAGAPSVSIPSPFSFTAFFQNHRYASAFAAFVLLIGGTAHASFDSLPGDPLYGIKINVIEPVALAIRLEETAKNEYRVAILQERVEEIQKLKTEGRLNFDMETISSVAASQNLAEIESSAMFTATGTNLEVSGYVETYNSLVEESHRLKTIIEVKPKKDGDDNQKDKQDGDEPASVTETVDGIASEVEEKVGDTVDTAATLTDPIVEDAQTIVDPIVPVIKKIGQ